ncbi:hypothetical protein BU17DRAFT_80370 [Hysterangium stoloniferum]|nr:hypothetical protein BU17DRAFT_80370 [Hysterangium stoloniferum]
MPHQCPPPNFFGPVRIDINIVIGDDDFPTNVLVSEARTITATWHNTPLRKYKNHVVYVGVFLDALLDFASKDPIPDSGGITGERYTAGVIYAAHKDGKVSGVAQAWFEGMVQPMKTAGYVRSVELSAAQTPNPLEAMMEAMVEPAIRSGQSRLRLEICQRQNYRCILHPSEVDECNVPFPDPIDQMPLPLQVGHIVPFSLNDFGGLHSSAMTWVMIKNWTSVSIQGLMGVGINNPSNGILFCPNGHQLFGNFRFWFEPTEGQHCYVVTSRFTALNGILVDFRSMSGVSPPDPQYIAIHAAFAKVMGASGAAEYLECILRDQEDIVSAFDGTADISSLLLNKFAAMAVR